MCGLCGVGIQVSAIQSHIQGKKHLGHFQHFSATATTRTRTDANICLLLEFPTINNCKISKTTHGQHVARAVYGTMAQMGAVLGVGDSSRQCPFSCSFHKSS
jgi:hypothetical protein